MLLSIIVSVYNTETYLDKCIKSILCQSFVDFELILVNDGSTDNSANICNQYAIIDHRIRVIHQKNGGLASARITGIRASQGEYICFVDSDDWVNPDMYERLMEPLKKDSGIDISIGGHVIDDLDGHVVFPLQRSNEKLYSGIQALEEMFLNRTFIWSLWDKIYRRFLFFDSTVLFCWPNSYGEDTFVNSKLIAKADKVAFMPVYGYHYCMHETSMMHEKFSSKQLVYLDIWSKIIDKYIGINTGIVHSVWNLMFPLGLRYLYLMHQKYEQFQYDLEYYQNLLGYYVKSLGGETNPHVQYWWPILRMSHKQFISWQTLQLNIVKSFFINCKRHNQKIYIYGAGAVAEKCIQYCNKYHFIVDGIVITKRNAKTTMMGQVIQEYDDIAYKKCGFIVGMNEVHSKQVIPLLLAQEHVYICASKFIF